MSENFQDELRDIASTLGMQARGADRAAEGSRLVGTLLPDEPIHSSAEDRLNRSGFATELARAIVRFDRTESVVIGIHGKWGTGKTSLLNLVHEKLQEESAEAPIIFRFNPWGFSDQEQLTARFFGELAAFLRLHMSIPSLAAVSDTVEEYGELLSPMARLLFPRATEAVRVGWKWFRKFKPKQSKSLAELKVHINSVLRESRSKLIIMIDDIDRLNATEIRQSFQLIELNANFSNTVYVVAFDKGPVEKALTEISPGPAREYLEKIVQVSFSLPRIADSTLTELILATFNEIIISLGIENLDLQRFGNMFHSGFRNSFRTIRDVNRYFNLFRFALNLMRRDTNFIDLAATEALALFDPTIYQAIELTPNLFCGGWRIVEQRDGKESMRSQYEKLFSRVPNSRRESVVSLCAFLFPKMEWVYGPSNSIYGSDFEQTWQKTKRIAATRYFPYYFQLAVPDTDVSQTELDTAINEATSVLAFVEVLHRFKSSQRFPAFIDSLRDHLGSLLQEQLLVILGSIFVFGDEVETEGPALFGIISEYIRFATWLLFDILDLLPPSNRFDMLCDAMRGQPAVFTISDITALLEKVVSGASDSARIRSKYPELNKEMVAEMKAISLAAIEQAASENRLQNTPQLGAVLYRWRQWGDPKHATDWVSATFLNSPRGAVSLVTSFARTVSSMSMTDKVPRTQISVPIQIISEFADLNLVAELLRNAPDEELADKERVAKSRFLIAKTKRDSGQDPDEHLLFDDDSE